MRRAAGVLVGRTCGPLLYRLLAATWRYECEPRDWRDRLDADGAILTLWHGRMLMSPAPFRGVDVTVLVSTSDDGDVSDALLKGLGLAVIRGSRSRGGSAAMRAMLAAIKECSIVAITPDGPRGPLHSMNPGPAWIARTTGRQILPAGFACDRAWQLKSWDRCSIPKPFARVRLHFAKPLTVPPGTNLESASDELRERMLSAERAAAEALGGGGGGPA